MLEIISLKHELFFFLITILLGKLLSFLFIFCSFKEVFSGKLLVLLSLLTSLMLELLFYELFEFMEFGESFLNKLFL